MARGRMLLKTLSKGRRINGLVNTHVMSYVLWSYMLPHLDDWGRMEADPYDIQSVCVPQVRYFNGKQGLQRIDECLRRIADANLILPYEVEGRRYLQWFDFEEQQEGLHRRTKPKIPEPPGNSGNARETAVNSSLNLREGEEKGTPLIVPPAGGTHRRRTSTVRLPPSERSPGYYSDLVDKPRP